MPEISRQQKQYLARQKKEKHIILAARTLLFVLFMGLWEISSDLGWIDSFIFSSPSLIAETFLSMCRDQSLFAHIAVTLAETLVSFFFVVILGVGTAVLLWCSRRIARILEPCLVVLNSLPKSALAPLLIVWLGANERTIVVAGMSVAIFGSVINLYSGFCQADPEKLKLIETLGGTQKGKASEDRPARLRSSYPKCDEGQHRALLGRRDHRRIYRCPKRPGIPDHLRKPDIQTYMGPDVHCNPLHHCHAAVFCTLSY